MTGSLQIKKDTFYIVLSYLDEDGKRKQKWINTHLETRGNKKRAQDLMRQTLEQYENFDLTYADKPVWKYFESWLDKQRTVAVPSTFRMYEKNMKTHVIPYFKETGLTLRNLKAYHIEDYYHMMMSKKKKDGKPYSATTVHHHHEVISKALSDAVRREYIPFNPAHNARTPKTQKYVGAFLNPTQLKQMLGLFVDTQVEHPVTMIATYGLRRSEALGLCWQYVDFENGQFTIARTMIQNNGENYVRDTTKNNSSYRTLPMTEGIKAMLLAIKAEQEENCELMGKEYHRSDFVFTWANGEPITPNYLSRVFHEKISKSDLPPVRLHDLRHSTATNLLANNFSVVEVQHWLGHSQPSTTLNFYSHVDSTSKQNISHAIEKLLPLEIR